MAYNKTNWVNGQAPAINAENLNKIEAGIESAHEMIENITHPIKQNSAESLATAAGITTYTNGARVTLEAGKWIVVGEWYYGTRASVASGGYNKEVRLVADNVAFAHNRIVVADRNASYSQVVSPLELTETTEVICQGSCSSATSSSAPDSCTIKAIKID